MRLLKARGLLPIVTATEITADAHPGPGRMHGRFRDFLREQGVERPRLKIMPVFALGRQPASGEPPLTEEDLEGFDRSMLQCADARVVAAGGVYACPILAGLPGRAALRREPRRVLPARAPLSPGVRDLPPDGDDVPEQLGEYRRIAVLGGVYSNALALEATLADARRARRGGGVLPGRHGRLRPAPGPRVPPAARARRARHPGQLRRVARLRAHRLRLRLHRPARQPLRARSATGTPSRARRPRTRRGSARCPGTAASSWARTGC